MCTTYVEELTGFLWSHVGCSGDHSQGDEEVYCTVTMWVLKVQELYEGRTSIFLKDSTLCKFLSCVIILPNTDNYSIIETLTMSHR